MHITNNINSYSRNTITPRPQSSSPQDASDAQSRVTGQVRYKATSSSTEQIVEGEILGRKGVRATSNSNVSDVGFQYYANANKVNKPSNIAAQALEAYHSNVQIALTSGVSQNSVDYYA